MKFNKIHKIINLSLFSLSLVLFMLLFFYGTNKDACSPDCPSSETNYWIQINGVKLDQPQLLGNQCYPAQGTPQTINSPLLDLKTLLELNGNGFGYIIKGEIIPNNSNCPTRRFVLLKDASTSSAVSLGYENSFSSTFPQSLNNCNFAVLTQDRFQISYPSNVGFKIKVILQICNTYCFPHPVQSNYQTYSWYSEIDVPSNTSPNSAFSLNIMNDLGVGPISTCFLYTCN